MLLKSELEEDVTAKGSQGTKTFLPLKIGQVSLGQGDADSIHRLQRTGIQTLTAASREEFNQQDVDLSS